MLDLRKLKTKTVLIITFAPVVVIAMITIGVSKLDPMYIAYTDTHFSKPHKLPINHRVGVCFVGFVFIALHGCPVSSVECQHYFVPRLFSISII